MLHTATHCTILHKLQGVVHKMTAMSSFTATRCNTLQYNATHCNTLHHITQIAGRGTQNDGYELADACLPRCPCQELPQSFECIAARNCTGLYIHAYTCAYIHVYHVCVYIHTRINIYMCVYILIYTYVYMFLHTISQELESLGAYHCTGLHIRIHMYACKYICIYMYLYVCVCIYIYMYASINL